MLGLALADGETEALGETLAEGLTEGDSLADGLTERDGETDGDPAASLKIQNMRSVVESGVPSRLTFPGCVGDVLSAPAWIKRLPPPPEYSMATT